MKTIHDWFAEYGESHQNHANKLIHWICIPMIFFSLIGLLASIPHQFLSNMVSQPYSNFFNFGTIFIIIGLLFYLRLSIPLFIGMLAMSILVLLGNYYLEKSGIAPLWLCSIIIFFIAWVGLFYGHKIEGKKPSFFKDLQFLLIGPAWILAFLYRKLHINY